jgi:hypothetical protein
MRGGLYWYVIGRVNGRPVFDGPHSSESKAYAKGSSIVDWDNNDWAVKSYRTSDLDTAKAMWKSEQAGKTGSMAQSLRPVFSVKSKSSRDEKLEEIRKAKGF